MNLVCHHFTIIFLNIVKLKPKYLVGLARTPIFAVSKCLE
nr:MAG TPA: hypothetical protein [Caudoviricetes sp.]